MTQIRSAFLLEQTLGHVTFAENLRGVADICPDVESTIVIERARTGRRLRRAA